MTIEVADCLSALEALREEWLALWRSCPTATPFQSPQWLLPWTRNLFGGGQICALALYGDNKLVGFAPFFRWGADLRTVSFLGAGISDYGDIVFAPDREADCVSLIHDFLRNEAILDLQEIRSSAGLLAPYHAEPCSVCPVLSLADFPACIDHKHRTDVRRARNKLQKDESLLIDFSTAETLAQDLECFFQLHAARWGELSPSLKNFHAEACSALQQTGNLRLCTLRIAGKAAAAIYAFTSGKTLYCYLSGFDPALAKRSPGAVLLGWLIEEAQSEGLQAVDFLRHGEAYKYLWGARNRTNYMIRLP